MKFAHRWAYVFILLGFLDGRLMTQVAYNGLPFPPEIRVPAKRG